jgi:ABC-type glutathione transport system ATPase component
MPSPRCAGPSWGLGPSPAARSPDLKARGLAIVFITHDLSLGNYISDRTVILRRGEIVEMGATAKVFGDPRHPYTRMLVASVPHLDAKWDAIPFHDGGLGIDEPDTSSSWDGDPALVQVEEDHLVAQNGGSG